MHKKYKTRIGAAMEEFLDLQKERSFCAADACHYMEQREIAVNITTVYRHLEQLVKDGILVKFKTADSDNQRYRLAGDVSRCQRHLHLQCRRCGRIQHWRWTIWLHRPGWPTILTGVQKSMRYI